MQYRERMEVFDTFNDICNIESSLRGLKTADSIYQTGEVSSWAILQSQHRMALALYLEKLADNEGLALVSTYDDIISWPLGLCIKFSLVKRGTCLLPPTLLFFLKFVLYFS
jgi:hypothetical protein